MNSKQRLLTMLLKLGAIDDEDLDAYEYDKKDLENDSVELFDLINNILVCNSKEVEVELLYCLMKEVLKND